MTPKTKKIGYILNSTILAILIIAIPISLTLMSRLQNPDARAHEPVSVTGFPFPTFTITPYPSEAELPTAPEGNVDYTQ